jgi:hypothetical protein
MLPPGPTHRASAYISCLISRNRFGGVSRSRRCCRSEEPLLCRWRMKQVKKEESRGLVWVRDYRGPWTSAAEITRQFREICEKVGIAGIIPYALRHSSIVRAIRAGLPIRLVAAMHDTSVEMIERHYSRFIVDGLEELTAKAIVPMIVPRLRRSREKDIPRQAACPRDTRLRRMIRGQISRPNCRRSDWQSSDQHPRAQTPLVARKG